MIKLIMHFDNAIKYFKLIDEYLIVNLINYVKLKKQKYLNNRSIKCKYD